MTKLNAIKYIIYRVAQQFNIYYGVEKNSVEKFNSENNFTLDKCLMLPYIITIANGKKNEFLDNGGVFENSFFPVFDDFERVLIGQIKDDDFVIYSDYDLDLNFKNGYLTVDENFFKDENYSLNDNIKNNIEYSIKFFEEKRFSSFSSFDSPTLGLITSQNSAFDVVKNFCDVRKIHNKKKIAELFNIAAKESFYFTYFNDNLEENIELENV